MCPFVVWPYSWRMHPPHLRTIARHPFWNSSDQTVAVLRGAEVALSGPDLKDIHTETNEQGTFIFNDFVYGQYSVNFTYVGFDPLNQIVNVRAGQATTAIARIQLAGQAQSVNVTSRTPQRRSRADKLRTIC
jgi:hypothetical protein